MLGPSDEFRHAVAESIDGLHSEGDLHELLYRIEATLRDDLPIVGLTEDEGLGELAAIEAWASLASDAVLALYAPGSWNLLRRNGHHVAGWSREAAERLRAIAGALMNQLAAVAALLRAVGFSIGVSFPWGISVSISW